VQIYFVLFYLLMASIQTVNRTYSTFIAHRNPEMCPLGAMAIYHHYLHDYYKLSEKMDIDWARNSSWRQVSYIFGCILRLLIN
jgi:hypothetical protein